MSDIIREEIIDTSDLEIKELEGYYDVFDSADSKIQDGEKEANSNIEEIKKENEERLLKAEEEAKKIEDAKNEIENLKESYKISLKQIYDSYQDKLEAINKAIEACSTNNALKGALEEEKGKMTVELDEKSSNIKNKIAELTSFLNKGSEEVEVEEKETTETNEDVSSEEIESIIKSIQEKINSLEEESKVKEESKDDDLEAIIRRIDEKINALKEDNNKEEINNIPTAQSNPNEIVEKIPVDEEQIKDILLSEEVNDNLERYLG